MNKCQYCPLMRQVRRSHTYWSSSIQSHRPDILAGSILMPKPRRDRNAWAWTKKEVSLLLEPGSEHYTVCMNWEWSQRHRDQARYPKIVEGSVWCWYMSVPWSKVPGYWNVPSINSPAPYRRSASWLKCSASFSNPNRVSRNTSYVNPIVTKIIHEHISGDPYAARR